MPKYEMSLNYVGKNSVQCTVYNVQLNFGEKKICISSEFKPYFHVILTQLHTDKGPNASAPLVSYHPLTWVQYTNPGQVSNFVWHV